MQSNQVGFESSFQQHLDAEQRRAVLEAIGASISPDSTLGEILDAAEALGWSEKMGELSLADLAEALLAPERGAASPTLVVAQADELDDDDLDEGDDELDDDELEDLDELDELDDDELEELDDDEELDDEFQVVIQESASKRGKAASKKAIPKKVSAKKTSSKKVSAKKASAKKAPAKKVSAKKTSKKAPAKEPPAAKKASKKASKKAAANQAPAKKTGKRKLTAVDVDDRMSLDQAAEFFLPYVEDLGEATMQALEEQTSVSRRKLRFHVGQLVKHGLLERHGMGRGTYYTKV